MLDLVEYHRLLAEQKTPDEKLRECLAVALLEIQDLRNAALRRTWRQPPPLPEPDTEDLVTSDFLGEESHEVTSPPDQPHLPLYDIGVRR